jgi:hypothetical protein
MMPNIDKTNHCRRCRQAPLGQLHCHRCDTDKPRREFYATRFPGRFHSGCKTCRREAARAYQRRTYVPVGARG